MQQFLNTSVMPKSLNETHITLIPKVKNPEEVSQFRPISLCNFSYKIVAKVMVNRMKHMSAYIMSPK